MLSSTRNTESRYPARSRTVPECMLVEANQPMRAIANEMAYIGRTRDGGQQQPPPRRVLALTTSRTFGEKSPIVNADIQAFLARCMSTSQWERYTEKEKATIMNSLPETRRPQGIASSLRNRSTHEENDPIKHHGNGDMLGNGRRQQIFDFYAAPPLPPSFCSDDQYLKRSIARFKRELSDGYYTKVWQDKAKRAHDERMDRKFDEYLNEHAEEMFLNEEEEGDEHAANQLSEESEDGEYYDGSRKRTRSGESR